MSRSVRRLAAVVSSCALLVACSIPPKADLPALRSEAPLAGLAVPAQGQWPDAKWWKSFHDPQLDDLQERALAASPDLAQAQRRLDAVLQTVESARAGAGLSAQGNLQAQRQRLSENGLIPPRFLGFTWYNQADLNAQFRYDFDFFGKTRAAIEGALDQARAAAAERSAASVALTAAVADTYYGWQADQARLALAKDSESRLVRLGELAEKRIARGIDRPDALHQAEQKIAAARELHAAYAGSAQLRLAALAALLGVSPAQLPALVARPLPNIDQHLPDAVGIDLIARRPDIAAARWRVEAALRQTDQVRAQFYPDISLGGMIGLQSLDFDKLFSAGSRTLGFGPALHLPLFERAQLKAAWGVSKAQLEAAAAQYDASVVNAARDVATQALLLEQTRARRSERQLQLDAARSLQQLADARSRQGLTDARAELLAQTEVLQQRDALATLDAQSISNRIGLIKALGGGWQREAESAVTPLSNASAQEPAR
ncbi:MAG: efflux transporter outer membrane subunit [Dokdonella sp.]|uniref:efflux transporter outer membrane subunit n=1 Tax=Dokdonella sp. TaxID=2291710 RepID=UPI0025B8A9B3|nr:efflux transporter outer membrane subunit [Dokdonella sp.]MBZ0222126.1 efflux transporter outer membrane subunit [Dokdonella sp.]MCC7254747.1 efflux transporter outer membrane subunit [Dokdonella sp.]